MFCKSNRLPFLWKVLEIGKTATCENGYGDADLAPFLESAEMGVYTLI